MIHSGGSVGAGGLIGASGSSSVPLESQGGSFSPLSLSGLQLWYDAGTVNVSGGLVTSWPDLSGHANTGTPNAADQRPASGVTTQNGFSVITGDGVNDDFFLASPVVLTDWDMVIVGKCKDAATDVIFFANDAANIQAAKAQATTNKLITFDGSQSGTSAVLAGSLANYSVLEWAQSSSVKSFFQNGTQYATTPGGVAAANMTVNTIWYWDGTPQPQASILAAMIFNRQLSATERSALVAYLRARFNV